MLIFTYSTPADTGVRCFSLPLLPGDEITEFVLNVTRNGVAEYANDLAQSVSLRVYTLPRPVIPSQSAPQAASVSLAHLIAAYDSLQLVPIIFDDAGTLMLSGSLSIALPLGFVADAVSTHIGFVIDGVAVTGQAILRVKRYIPNQLE